MSSGDIRHWRSGLTLVVFLLTNLVVVFPFSCPLPGGVVRKGRQALVWSRVIPDQEPDEAKRNCPICREERDDLRIPFNFVTAPFFAVLVLLAFQAIGGDEIRRGIIGSNHIHPIDIMAFFLALAYMAISLDTTGLVRYSAWWVLKKAGNVGHRLFFLLYLFFFGLGSFIGNDPIILSGTSFLAYLTRVAANIEHPRAWIFTQFTVANVASAILVSSNPTNLVLAGAFEIKFFLYTANMIVPVLCTGLVLFPFLLYIVFPSEKLIPLEIVMHSLPATGQPSDEQLDPAADTASGAQTDTRRPGPDSLEERYIRDREYQKQLPLEDLLDPYIESKGALFGGVLIAVTLGTLLAVNATGRSPGVYAVTVPAAFIMLCRDVISDLRSSESSRAEKRRLNGGSAHWQDPKRCDPEDNTGSKPSSSSRINTLLCPLHEEEAAQDIRENDEKEAGDLQNDSGENVDRGSDSLSSPFTSPSFPESTCSPVQANGVKMELRDLQQDRDAMDNSDYSGSHTLGGSSSSASAQLKSESATPRSIHSSHSQHRTAYSMYRSTIACANQYIPTVYTVVQHLPFALIPFAFCMFIIVEGLVTKGWIELFAKGWAAWAKEVGVVGCIAGMGFVSVVLCNFAGTNIGATILLSRVLQTWLQTHTPSDRMKEATIYALALGVNYGAFSITFSASLAGLLWRDILGRKYIRVRRLDFARINVPIIAICMAVGCGILAAQA